jgi:hypothetical protein
MLIKISGDIVPGSNSRQEEASFIKLGITGYASAAKQSVLKVLIGLDNFTIKD